MNFYYYLGHIQLMPRMVMEVLAGLSRRFGYRMDVVLHKLIDGYKMLHS